MVQKKNILGVTKRGLASLCIENQWPVSHAATVYSEVYRKKKNDFLSFEKIPLDMKEYLSEHYVICGPQVSERHISEEDGSVKFLVKLIDGSFIETVLMPERTRYTVCVSSQVGCAQACSFCYTGRMGMKRNLTAEEIVFQVYLADNFLKENSNWRCSVKTDPKVIQLTNIVFMGMGEPLDNVENVGKAIEVLTDAHGFSVSIKRISVSTAGHLDGLQRLRDLCPNIRYAISLHGPNDRIRNKIMPINRKWPLTNVLEAIKSINVVDGNPVFIQYILIAGVNDSIECAIELRSVLKNLDVKVNLIPFNDVEPTRFKAPSREVIEKFQDALYSEELRTMVRYSKGQDIGAACGQLVDQAAIS